MKIRLHEVDQLAAGAEAQVDLVCELTSRYPHAHGAPVHIGNPEAIGITGTLRSGKVATPIKGKLKGDEIVFNAAGRQYTGRVNGNVMEGQISSGESWKATRAVK